MNFIPYKSNLSAWTNHFKSQSKHRKQERLYIIKKGNHTGAGPLQIISPSEEVVQRARASTKKSNTVQRKKKTTFKKKPST